MIALDGRSPAPTVFAPVLAKLRVEAGRHFGAAHTDLVPVAYEERPYSHLLRVKVRLGNVGAPDPHVFIKVFKPKPHDGGVDKMRARVAHDFATTRRIHAAMARLPDLAAVRPIAFYADDLAIVTEEAQGVTLLAELHARSAWFPGPQTRRSLEATMGKVGRWIRAFQLTDTSSSRVPIGSLREYVDLRLGKLTDRKVLDPEERQRILDHLDALGRRIEPADLREVIAHADLAPGNILVSGARIVVLDFAMANRASALHDISRLFLQLDLLRAKPQFRSSVIRTLQDALLEGYDAGLTADRPLFRFLLMLHRVNHLGTLSMGRERFLARAFSGHIQRQHRRWIARELAAGVSHQEPH